MLNILEGFELKKLQPFSSEYYHLLVEAMRRAYADRAMNLQQAIDSPRIHHQWLPDEIKEEPLGLSTDTRRALEALGHKFAPSLDYVSDAQGIMIEEKTNMRLGASDARHDGAAVGY